MSRVVYLHVGAPKTGTSYLQDRLRINRTQLARHGVHYPLGIHASHFRPALDLLDRSWQGLSRASVVGSWDSLMGRVRRLDGTVVISHEILASASPEQVAKAMADLGDSEVHVVYSARDIARQLTSGWQEGVKHGDRRPLARFLKDMQRARRQASRKWFWRVHGLPDVLTRWGSGLSPERVHLVTVPPPGAAKELLWSRFCAAFGIEESWAPQDSKDRNPSLGIAEVALVRRLNRRLSPEDLDGATYRSLVRKLLAEQTLARREGMRIAMLPPDAYPWAEQVAEEWVEWAEGAGIDVVGDLEELRVVPPDDPDSWVDPDRVPPRQVLDAALDGLVAMTKEAAARPDPNQQLVRKVRRATNRLRGGV